MAEKKAKLAIALKANIKRRKDQAKEAETGQSPPETSGEE
jgi:hypothetical protein